jgi:putative restriction endonuclease
MTRRNWSRDELILAFNLYCKTPFGRIHIRNPEIIALAKLIGRTPSAVSWKLANFARLDPSLQKRQIAGAVHGSRLDAEIWAEFNHDWERLSFESEKLLAAKVGKPIESIAEISISDLPEGKEKESVVRVRINQSFFRKAVLAAYDYRCCITGLNLPELLNASHIVPWSIDVENRVNPHNGLCLNAIHDRAFDRGLMTVTPELRVKISPVIKTTSDLAVHDLLLRYDDISIQLPSRFTPNHKFLAYHNNHIFRAV